MARSPVCLCDESPEPQGWVNRELDTSLAGHCDHGCGRMWRSRRGRPRVGPPVIEPAGRLTMLGDGMASSREAATWQLAGSSPVLGIYQPSHQIATLADAPRDEGLGGLAD